MPPPFLLPIPHTPPSARPPLEAAVAAAGGRGVKAAAASASSEIERKMVEGLMRKEGSVRQMRRSRDGRSSALRVAHRSVDAASVDAASVDVASVDAASVDAADGKHAPPEQVPVSPPRLWGSNTSVHAGISAAPKPPRDPPPLPADPPAPTEDPPPIAKSFFGVAACHASGRRPGSSCKSARPSSPPSAGA